MITILAAVPGPALVPLLAAASVLVSAPDNVPALAQVSVLASAPVSIPYDSSISVRSAIGRPGYSGWGHGAGWRRGWWSPEIGKGDTDRLEIGTGTRSGKRTGDCSGRRRLSTTGLNQTFLLDELQTTITIVVVQNDKERLQISDLLTGNNLVNLGQVVIGEVGWQHCHSLHKGVVPLVIGRAIGWNCHQKRTRVEPTHLVGAAGVVFGVDGAQLVQDGNSDLGIRGDLVSDRHTLQCWWARDRMNPTEESGENISDS